MKQYFLQLQISDIRIKKISVYGYILNAWTWIFNRQYILCYGADGLVALEGGLNS